MTHDEIKDAIKQFILDTYLPGESPENLTDETPLRTGGVLDSMAILNLVSFIEQRFGIEIEAHETSVENFDRLSDLATFVAGKRALAHLQP